MNRHFREALESMLQPDENGWAFNEKQRDCARILLGLEPCEGLKGLGLTLGDIIASRGNTNPWCYDLSAAPVDCKLQVSARTKTGNTVYMTFRGSDGVWRSGNKGYATAVYAWREYAKDEPAELPDHLKAVNKEEN